MKKPIPKIRVFGQRSIVPSFQNRSSIPVEDSSSKKVDKCASFSEFLDRKLNKSVLFKAKKIEEGPSSFTSLVSSNQLSQAKKEKKIGVEKTMLEQFKPRETLMSSGKAKASLETTAEEIDLLTTCFSGIEEDIIVKDSKKRKDPFEGMNRTRKTVLVFGDNSEEGERGSSSTSKKQRPAYNHYANGSGFWDCDMEGVDSEEVGHSEVWEGVGSTTFGDIVDWH